MAGALPPAKGRRRLFLALGAVLALCVLLAAALVGHSFLRPRAAPGPVVTIRWAGHGEKVRVGEPLAVHSAAEGQSPTVRIELWADGTLQDAQSAASPGEASPFVLHATWRPPTPGPHTLTARAFDAKGGRAHASVTVEAVTEPDRDHDGAPDVQDACPEQPGGYTAGGCLDGDRPDLVITGVTQEPTSGQLRIHVFDNAAALNNQDIDVNIVRASANEQIALETWREVSIPSGGSVTLQSSDLVLEPYDLRAIVDPDNRIEETDERNNIYETTVVMRVEFLGISNRPCSDEWDEDGCTPLFCNEGNAIGAGSDSEHVFRLWAGHGPSRDAVVWAVGDGVRFPASDEAKAYWGPSMCDDADMGGWRLDGDGRYSVEFEMPAGENLYVRAQGREADVITDDDHMGEIFEQYRPGAGWGARAEPYNVVYTGAASCDDPDCRPWGARPARLVAHHAGALMAAGTF